MPQSETKGGTGNGSRAPAGAMRWLMLALSASAAFAAVPVDFAAADALHYAPNRNFDKKGRFLPGSAGFNVADVSSARQTASLPSGVQGLAWIGECNGVTSSFVTKVSAYAASTKLWGFYLFDDAYSRTCKPANLKAQSDWIRAHIPNAKVFVALANGGSFKAPFYTGYNLETTGADYLGIAAYPCRSELSGGLGGCDFDAIDRIAKAAEAAEIPASAVVPIFQAFGGGTWIEDGGGHYLVPTPDQARAIVARWCRYYPAPVLDYAYTWGSQRGSQALENTPALRDVFALHNKPGSPCAP
jgi:serralysin